MSIAMVAPGISKEKLNVLVTETCEFATDSRFLRGCDLLGERVL
jgi:hypothetical protein